jgi:membrane-associated phospholipid phosphatase
MVKAVLYDWGGLNVWLFHLINGMHDRASDAVMAAGSYLGDYSNFTAYVAVAAVLFALSTARQARIGPQPALDAARCGLAVLAVWSTAQFIDSALVSWLKVWLDFPRPAAALAPGSVHFVGPILTRYSLPSGHATFAMTAAAALWPALGRRSRAAAVVAVLWVGVSRLSVGAHFPADVLAGFGIGFLTVVAVRRTLEGLLPRPGHADSGASAFRGARIDAP